MKHLLSFATVFALLGCGDLNVNGDPSVSVNTQGAKVDPVPAATKTEPAPAPGKAPLQAAESKWTGEEFKRNVPACAQQAVASTQKTWPEPMNTKEAEQFCVCYINAISKVYDFGTYEKDHEEIGEQPAMLAQGRACTDAVTSSRAKVSAALCAPGKICKGQTKAEVLAVIGKPTSVLDTTTGGQTWIYTEDPRSTEVCANVGGGTWTYLQCTVTFNKAAVLIAQDQINPEKLDLSNW